MIARNANRLPGGNRYAMDAELLRDRFRDGWDGPRWWLWTFGAGVVLVLLTVAVMVPLAYLLGHDPKALTMLGLLAEILILSMLGSGFVDSMSRRLTMGGLTRETADLGNVTESERERAAEEQRQKAERRTLRAGIVVFPMFLLFCILLFG